MFDRRSIPVALVAAAVLAGCRGGAGGNALPATSQSFQGAGDAAAIASLKFKPIGPTRMSDGLPTSGKVNAYAIDPKNPKIIYMASGRGTGLETYSSAGILRTTDGGASWQTIDKGLTDTSGSTASVVNSLWLDSVKPSVLLAATEYDGIFRSSDGGSSWTSVYRTTQATQFASFGNALFATGKAGILVSNDDGVTWAVQFAASGTQWPTAFGAVQGSSGKAFYAGMSTGTIFAFAGGKWSKAGTLPYDKHTGTGGSVPAVHQIAVDPYVPTTVYASSNDGSWDQDLHASTDSGKTWNKVLASNYYSYGLGTQAIAFSLVHPHRLYIGADGLMYYITGDGSPNPPASNAANLSIIDLRNIWTSANGSDDACWIASDQGLDYEPTCSAYGGRYNDRVVSATSATGLARRFVVSPDGKTVLTSLQDFNSHLTTDGGATWRVDGLYEDGFSELRPGDPSACYAYDEASGLSISTDGCQSFHGSSSKATPSRLMTTPIAFDPRKPLTMYLTSGPNSAPGIYGPKGVFKTTDGGTTIAQLSWPFAWPGAIAVDPHDGTHIIVSDIRNGRSLLSVTSNGGKTWKKSSGTIGTPFWYAITISPADGKTILASSVDSSQNVFVLRSSDGGLTFTRVATVTNAPLIRGRIDRDRSLLVTPGQPRKARHEEEQSPSQAFVYSPEREIRYNQDVTKGTPTAAITTLRGAFLSTDNGSTWTRVDGGSIAHSFWGIHWVGGYLYIASDGRGVLRSTTQVQTTSRRR
ncbi:MAG: hypothetical protein ABI231_03255 [Candidatus Tumulicola sp.]